MKFLAGIVLVICILSVGLVKSQVNPVTDKPIVTSSEQPSTSQEQLIVANKTDVIKPAEEEPDTTEVHDETTLPETTTKPDDANTTTSTTTTTTTTSTAPTTPTTTTTPNTTTTTTTTTTTSTTPIPTTSTSPIPTTSAPISTTTEKPDVPRSQWSTTSFIGGMVFAFGMMAIGFVSFKFYKARNERNYHTL